MEEPGLKNVKLVRSKNQAIRLIRQAFGRGFPLYDPVGSIKERWRLFRNGKTPLKDILEGIVGFLLLHHMQELMDVKEDISISRILSQVIIMIYGWL